MSLSCSLSLSAFCTAESARVTSDFAADPVGDALRAADVLTGDAELGDEEAFTAFFSSSSLRFFSACFLRSSGLVVLVNAIDLPSGDQTGSPAPLGKSVNTKASPPPMGSMHNCGGSGLPSFSVARMKTRNLPSGDQRGIAS